MDISSTRAVDNFRNSLSNISSERVSIQYFSNLLNQRVVYGRLYSTAVVEKILDENSGGRILALFYLIDSVVKSRSVGRQYQSFFAPRLYEIFTYAYNTAKNESMKCRFLKLFKTWYYIFPIEILLKVEAFLRKKNQNISISAVTKDIGRPARKFLVNPLVFRGRSNMGSNMVRPPPKEKVAPPPPIPHIPHVPALPMKKVVKEEPRTVPPPPLPPPNKSVMGTNVSKGGTLYISPNQPLSYPPMSRQPMHIPHSMNPSTYRLPPAIPNQLRQNQMMQSHQMRVNHPRMQNQQMMIDDKIDSSLSDLLSLAAEVNKELQSKEDGQYKELISSLYGDLPLVCQECGLRFRNQQNCDRHTESHTELESKLHLARKWWAKSSDEWSSHSEVFKLEDVVIDPMNIIFGEGNVQKMEDEETGDGNTEKSEKVFFDVEKEVCPFCGDKITSQFDVDVQEWVFERAMKVEPKEYHIDTDKQFGLGPNFFFVVHEDCSANVNRQNIELILESEKKKLGVISTPTSPLSPPQKESPENTLFFSPPKVQVVIEQVEPPVVEVEDDNILPKKRKIGEVVKEDGEEEVEKQPKKRKVEEE